MSEKVQYLAIIQENIRRYGWQSFIVKVLTVCIASLFITASMLHLGAAAGSIPWAFGVALCFLLWLADGHYADMQDRYSLLYRDAAQSGEANYRMRLDVSTGVNVKAVWQPLVVGFYVPVMGMLILLGLKG
jgi:hypothetical protein